MSTCPPTGWGSALIGRGGCAPRVEFVRSAAQLETGPEPAQIAMTADQADRLGHELVASAAATGERG